MNMDQATLQDLAANHPDDAWLQSLIRQYIEASANADFVECALLEDEISARVSDDGPG